MPIDLTPDDARRVALWRQGLLGSPPPVPRSRPAQVGRVRAMVASLGAVQLDTISVLARSHELVAYARLGALPRTSIEEAYWGDGASFEYWSHAACILPMASWPWFAFRRRHYARRGAAGHRVTPAAARRVRARLADGPLTTREIGGAKRSGEWWDWSESKEAIEYLLNIGEVICTERTGWRRVYDLAERVVPSALRRGRGWVDDDGVAGPADEACLRQLVAEGARTIGIGPTGDIADVHRLPNAAVTAHAADVGLVRVSVRGWPGAVWSTPEALAWLDTSSRPRHRTTLLSPFDSLIWHRARTERLFGMTHRLEAYTPAPKRVHGYFAMPVLHRGALIARVDPKRDGSTLIADRVTIEGAATQDVIDGVASALREAAEWVGCTSIRIGATTPASAAAPLRRAVSA